MLTAFKLHSTYFILLLGYLLIGGIALLFIEKGDVLLYFSDHRTAFGDLFFKWATQLGEFVPYLAGFGAFLLMKQYKKAIALPLLAAAVTIVSFITKSVFKQPRPARYFKDLDQFEVINQVAGVVLNQGDTSFPSGHTMSAFAVSTFFLLCFPQKWWLDIVLFTVALLTAASRIYLVQHFFQDVYLGAILGILIGLLSFLLLSNIENRAAKQV